MSYSNNPLLPKARAQAVRLVVEQHMPISIAARRSGVHRVTLWRWYKQWQARGYSGWISALPTRSSRPRTFGRAVSAYVVERIRHYRVKYRRCAVIVHAHCLAEGVSVSLSTVRRVLDRLGMLTKRGKWKRYRPSLPRPAVTKPGDLVQTDTIHLTSSFHGHTRVYLYTLVDVCSRWAYAEYHTRLGQDIAAAVIQRGQTYAGFHFQIVQADNGPEFGRSFEELLQAQGTDVRHSRVRRPNDNAHIERFNRTIQEECIGSTNPFSEELYGKVLTYLAYYNEERLHLSLQCRTPASVAKVLS